VREFRFSLARKGVGLTALFLLFRLSCNLARFSLWVVDGARSCCCSGRSAAERGQPEGLQGRWGALWAFAVPVRLYGASGSTGGT
jgi:hypothetical protein